MDDFLRYIGWKNFHGYWDKTEIMFDVATICTVIVALVVIYGVL